MARRDAEDILEREQLQKAITQLQQRHPLLLGQKVNLRCTEGYYV